jgi:endonuclease G
MTQGILRLTLKLTVLFALAGIGVQFVSAQTIAVTHCFGECPKHESRVTANQSRVVIHNLYAASVNGETALADWVAYRLTKDAIGIASLLPREWQPDRLIRFSPLEDIVQEGEEELRLSESITRNNNPYGGGAAQRVEPENRARLAPMTSFANTPYWSDLNNFSNMVPMPATLRLGPWLRLEQSLNQMVVAGEEAYVIAGPLYLINILSLSPSSSDLEPAGYFKVISDQSGALAFLFNKDMEQAQSYCDQKVSINEIQQMTGLQFFPDRPVPRESAAMLAKLGCAR